MYTSKIGILDSCMNLTFSLFSHPGATGGWGKRFNRPILFCRSGPFEGIAVSNLRPGHRSHCLNGAKCDFELSLHSALFKPFEKATSDQNRRQPRFQNPPPLFAAENMES